MLLRAGMMNLLISYDIAKLAKMKIATVDRRNDRNGRIKPEFNIYEEDQRGNEKYKFLHTRLVPQA